MSFLDPSREFDLGEAAPSTTPADTEYARDPDRDSALVVDLFFTRLGEELVGSGLDPDLGRKLVDQARERQRELSAADGDSLPDAPARYNRRYTTAVLSAYQVLSRAPASAAGAPTGSSLLALLTRAFVEPLAEAVTAGTRAMLDSAEDPFAAMVAVARSRERVDFGAEFVFAHPVNDDERFFAEVRRCGYHEYFRHQGVPGLTRVLCAFDVNWINAIDPGRHGFTFTRSTTIGQGGLICPFHFQRSGSGRDSGRVTPDRTT